MLTGDCEGFNFKEFEVETNLGTFTWAAETRERLFLDLYIAERLMRANGTDVKFTLVMLRELNHGSKP